MKILLADDERMVRLSFISMCEELFPGMHQFTEARNGREMLALGRQLLPDLAFVDIRMPLMDGLSTIEELQNYCPDTQFIILSGHSEFAYAQRAIQLGAIDYLLKPPSLEDIAKVFALAEANLKKKITSGNQIFFYESIARFNTYSIFREMEQNMEGNLSAYLFCADYSQQEGQLLFYKELYQDIQRGVSRCIRQPCQHSLFHLPEGELCLILNSSVKTFRPPEFLHEIIMEFGVPLTIFQVRGSHLEEIFKKILSMMDMFPLRIFCGYGHILHEEKILRFAKDRSLLDLCKDIENMQMAWQEKNALAYQKFLESITVLAEAVVLEEQIDWEGARNYIHHYFHLQGDICGFSSLLTLLGQGKEIIYHSFTPISDPHITDKVKEYVEKHYMEDIGINSIACICGITPNYLSKIFHQKEGCRFIDYLTNVRISHAKGLLISEGALPIYRIAELSGYSNTRYFSKVFQKITGQTPTDYRKEQGGSL